MVQIHNVHSNNFFDLLQIEELEITIMISCAYVKSCNWHFSLNHTTNKPILNLYVCLFLVIRGARSTATTKTLVSRFLFVIYIFNLQLIVSINDFLQHWKNIEWCTFSRCCNFFLISFGLIALFTVLGFR